MAASNSRSRESRERGRTVSWKEGGKHATVENRLTKCVQTNVSKVQCDGTLGLREGNDKEVGSE